MLSKIYVSNMILQIWLKSQPTCHKGPTPFLLDVILVSNSRRYASIFNVFCGLSDFHNIIGAAIKRFAPSQKPWIIHYRSFKKIAEPEFLYDIGCAPFNMMEIFDDNDDMAWYTSAHIRSVINEHAPMKSKVVKSASVPYMNSALRKAQYKRNMARNKFRKFGRHYWEENRRTRNHVVNIRKISVRAYFKENCSKHDKNFWATTSPFVTDKRFRDANNIILRESDNIVTDPSRVSELFNDYFYSVAMDIGFDDCVTSISDAVGKHISHPSFV